MLGHWAQRTDRASACRPRVRIAARRGRNRRSDGSAAAEAEIAADFVVSGVGGDRLGEDEVDAVVTVAGETEAGAERQGAAACGARSPNLSRHQFDIAWSGFAKRRSLP